MTTHEDLNAIKDKEHATNTEVHEDSATERQRLDNDLEDKFAKLGADTHKPPMRVSLAATSFKSLARQAARWAAEAHFILRHGAWRRHRGLRPCIQKAQESRKDQSSDVQDAGALGCFGRKVWRLHRGTVWITGTDRSGQPKVS